MRGGKEKENVKNIKPKAIGDAQMGKKNIPSKRILLKTLTKFEKNYIVPLLFISIVA